METLFHDLRHAARGLHRAPLFTLACILTLALALGANAAIFNLSWAVLFRELPYGEPERIVAIQQPPLAFSAASGGFTLARSARESPVLEAAALYYPDGGANLEVAGEAMRVHVAQVSTTFLRTLGVTPLIGRDFADTDGAAGSNQVALLGERVWRDRFEADPAVIGGTIRLNGVVYSVLGVLPERFEFPAGAQVWLPLPFVWEFATGSAAGPSAIGRLRAGVDRITAEQSLEAAVTESRPRDPGEDPLRLVPLHAELTRGLRTPLFVLLGAVTAVLLIGCVNLSGLMLARVSARQREFAVRGALGAGTFRITRQLLAESLLLAVLGAGAAALLVAWTLDGMVALFPAGLLPTERLASGSAVFVHSTGIALLTAVLFALAPALHAAHASRRLPRPGGVSEDPGGVRVRSAMLIAEIALSFVLVVSAALLARTMSGLHDVPLGFQPDRLLTFRMTLPETTYPARGAQRLTFTNDVLERVRGMPGVLDAAIGNDVPLSSELGAVYRMALPGETLEQVMARESGDRSGVYTLVTPDWFRTFGIETRAGRVFAEADAAGERVWVVDERVARGLFPDGGAVGQRVAMWFGRTQTEGTIAGVVAGIRDRSVIDEPTGQIYELFGRSSSNLIVLAVRFRGSRAATVEAVRSVLRQIDPALPPHDVLTMDDVVRASLGSRAGVTFVMSAFALLALLLSAIGLYATIAESVTQRRREIGLRMALGSRRAAILGIVLKRGLWLAGAGTVIGLAGAAGATRALASLLFGVQPVDLPTFAAVATMLLGVAAAACAIPALRASRIDPMTTLRE